MNKGDNRTEGYSVPGMTQQCIALYFRFSRPVADVAATQALYVLMQAKNSLNSEFHQVICWIARRLPDLR